MTDKKPDETKTEERTAEEIAAAEAKDAIAGFSKGFKTVHGDSTPSDDHVSEGAEKIVQEKADEEAKVKTEEAEKAEKVKADEEAALKVQEGEASQLKFMEGLPKRLRAMEGHIGGMMSKMDTLATATKPAAESKTLPTREELKVALANPEAMKNMVEEFEEFKPVQDELLAIRKDMARAPSIDVGKIETAVVDAMEARMQDVLELNKLDVKYPEWRETINTPEFKPWSLEGGPSLERYEVMKALEEVAPEKANAMIDVWETEFPQWWANRGAKIYSPKASDSIKLLDNYEGRQKTASAAVTADRLKKEKRLAGAVTPVGTVGEHTAGIDDQTAFRRGFKRARGT